LSGEWHFIANPRNNSVRIYINAASARRAGETVTVDYLQLGSGRNYRGRFEFHCGSRTASEISTQEIQFGPDGPVRSLGSPFGGSSNRPVSGVDAAMLEFACTRTGGQRVMDPIADANRDFESRRPQPSMLVCSGQTESIGRFRWQGSWRRYDTHRTTEQRQFYIDDTVENLTSWCEGDSCSPERIAGITSDRGSYVLQNRADGDDMSFLSVRIDGSAYYHRRFRRSYRGGEPEELQSTTDGSCRRQRSTRRR
jgi:hypothetical protein